MKNRRLLGAGLALLSLTVSISSVSASTSLYGNLGSVSASTTSNTVGYLSPGLLNQFQAQGFTLGAYDYDLTSLDFGLDASGAPSPVAQLFGDNSGAPGSALATFTLSSAVGTKGIYNFTGSFAAQKNTSYWVVLSNANSASFESFEWYSNDSFTAPTGLNDSLITYLGTAESNNGALWPNTLPSLSIQVNGELSAIPEPSSSMASLCLLAGGTLVRRRARRVAQRSC